MKVLQCFYVPCSPRVIINFSLNYALIQSLQLLNIDLLARFFSLIEIFIYTHQCILPIKVLCLIAIIHFVQSYQNFAESFGSFFLPQRFKSFLDVAICIKNSSCCSLRHQFMHSSLTFFYRVDKHVLKISIILTNFSYNKIRLS